MKAKLVAMAGLAVLSLAALIAVAPALIGSEASPARDRAGLVNAVRDATEQFKDVNAAASRTTEHPTAASAGPKKDPWASTSSRATWSHGAVDAAHPEALLYEVRKNGRNAG